MGGRNLENKMSDLKVALKGYIRAYRILKKLKQKPYTNLDKR